MQVLEDVHMQLTKLEDVLMNAFTFPNILSKSKVFSTHFIFQFISDSDVCGRFMYKNEP